MQVSPQVHVLFFVVLWFFNLERFFFLKGVYIQDGASQVALVVKNPPANVGDLRDEGSIPGLGRSRGGGHGNQLQ